MNPIELIITVNCIRGKITDKGWILSPAFDINPSIEKDGLALNIETHNNGLDVDLAKSVGEYFQLRGAEMNIIIKGVNTAVSGWKTVAREIGISRAEQELMSSAFRYERHHYNYRNCGCKVMMDYQTCSALTGTWMADGDISGLRARRFGFGHELWKSKPRLYEDGYFDPYYDGLMYLLSLMHLSGKYPILKSGK